MNATIRRSSGNKALDARVLHVVKSVSLSPMPPELKQLHRGIGMEFQLVVSSTEEEKLSQQAQIDDVEQQARTLLTTGKVDEAVKVLEANIARSDVPAALSIHWRAQLCNIYTDQATLLDAKTPGSKAALELAIKAHNVYPADYSSEQLVDKLKKRSSN